MTVPQRSTWFSRWDLLPLLATLALALALPSLLGGLPDPMPTHFDGRGHPNGWMPHAAYPWICFGLSAFIWLLLLLTGRAFAGTDQDPEGRKATAMGPLRGLLIMGILALMGAVPLIPRFGMHLMGWMVALVVGLLILGIVLMVQALQAEGSLASQSDGYRWGLVYMNPQDSRIWVPKRLGLGWTLNFGQRLSWFILILLLCPPLLIIGFLLNH